MSPRALVPLLLLVGCAIGDDEPTPMSSASMPTMPGYVPTTGFATDVLTSEVDPTNDPTPASSPATDPPDPSTTSGEPLTTGPAQTTSGPVDTGDDTTTTQPPDPSTTNVDTGPQPCEDTCLDPPNPCYDSPGNCINGLCDYAPSADAKPCDDGNECTTNDVCNGAGSCGGTPLDCVAPGPNATGGTCQNGSCNYGCVDPYENCDGDWANGCEVPTGVAHVCDQSGINPDGCWTAYCGNSNSPKAHNFGAYFCMDCATCNEPSPGQNQWCNHTTGKFYPYEAGSCGSYNDLVCAP